MSPDPTDDDRPSTDAVGGDARTDPDRADGSTETAVSRRHALLGVGLGLGLLERTGRPAPGRGMRQWNRDVDAGGNDLVNLGGLNTDAMADDAVVADFAGANLEIDDASLNVTDTLGVDGLEVERVDAPDGEDLTVESGGDLTLSLSGGTGSVRIETAGGHRIVLDDEDGAESVTVEDSAGNGVEMDAATGEVSVTADQTITLDAPSIELSADADVTIDSGGTTDVGSAGITTLDGALVNLGGSGGLPAARVGDTVANGVIQMGSTVVLIS